MAYATRNRFRISSVLLLTAGIALNTGCSMDDLVGSDDLPPDLTDPAITHTAAGARAVLNGALVQFRIAFAGSSSTIGSGVGASVIGLSGLLSDELHAGGKGVPEDMHFMPEGEIADNGDGSYSRLQRTRAQSGQAIALLQRYDPENVTGIAHAYAVQGYSEVFLAELFCSGVPLSTLDFDGDFTYQPGSTTEQVFERAIVHFDSAMALAGDSVRIRNLAKIGRARALVGLGRFDEAATSVADIPDDWAYQVSFIGGLEGNNRSFTTTNTSAPRWTLMVADRKGLNGLDYVTSGDPRSVAPSISTNTARGGMPVYFPSKYTPDGAGSYLVASGIEARLIEAEAALRAGDGSWLEKLNHLRRTAYTTIRPAVTEPLPDLTDPGTDETRVDLLFRERALWLFLTGHRQNDMRRLVRQYSRAVDRLYPVGEMPGPDGLSYGGHIDVPIPASESLSNPLFTGCLDRAN